MTESPAPLFSIAGCERFLAEHWQREPLFLPAALARLPATPDWRSLAAREDVETRRVVTHADGRLRSSDGPFTGADPRQPWTVLIQDADYHTPALRTLFGAVDFLPAWRTEDIMMSVATAGGSVGPHVDAYDVFLVQASGTRRWDIGRRGAYTPAPDDGGLRLVQPFDVEQRIEATPGDVLYLPPDVPHHGVAQDDCITYSIGFRAPTLHELATVALEKLPGDRRYADPGAQRAADAARIDAGTIARLRAQLDAYLALDDATLAASIGEIMTEVKPWLEPGEVGIDQTDISGASGALCLAASRGTRLAYFEDSKTATLFANGRAYALASRRQLDMAQALARERRAVCEDEASCRALAQILLDDGIVRIEHDD